MIAVQAVQLVTDAKLDGAKHLSDLGAAHECLGSAMRQMERLTRGSVPPKETLASARLLISRASLYRRRTWGEIYSLLISVVSPDDLRKLNQLRAADILLQQASTEHVATWPIDTALDRWKEYCEASAAIRWKMRAALQMERLTLYPILSRYT